ncbi:MAG: hypothetical protein WAV93_08695 [Bacteroidales bacterium]
MSDVEPIQILKDAPAAAIYSSGASIGVVKIQTRRGKAGATRFDVQYTACISESSRIVKWLNAEQYLQLFDEAIETAPDENGWLRGEEGFTKDLVWETFVGETWDDGYDTDGQKEVFQKGSLNRVNVSASGGNENTRFYAGVSFDETKGILRSNNMNKMSARLNLGQKASEKLSFGVRMNVIRTLMDRVQNDNAFATLLQLVAQSPLTPVYDPETGELNIITIYYNGLISLRDEINTQTSFRSLANLNASYNIFKHLTFRSEFGTDICDHRGKNFRGRETVTGGPAGEAQNRSVRVVNYNRENYLTYIKSMGVHPLNVVGGISYQQSNTIYVSNTWTEAYKLVNTCNTLLQEDVLALLDAGNLILPIPFREMEVNDLLKLNSWYSAGK